MVEALVSVAALLVVLATSEMLLRRGVRVARRSFQWLITEEDELPDLDRAALARFIDGSFSVELGWEPVPGTRGQDVAHGEVSSFTIGPDGARGRPDGTPAPTVALFGDSYAFGRQVDDHEAWPALLGLESHVGVLNYGVGNYGVDQALLRFRRVQLPAEVDTVIAAFVPETICRVQSVWKHWMEFGNTFGFKPRFVLVDGRLELQPNPVRSSADYDDLAGVIEAIGDEDPFRRARFRRHQFRAPYLRTFLRSPVRHGTVLATVLMGRTSDGGLAPKAFERAFARIMRSNVREAHRSYRRQTDVALLSAILERFRDEVEGSGRRFIVCVIPQYLDLRAARSADRSYRDYLRRLSLTMAVVDLTEDMLGHDSAGLFIHDRYGGHLSRAGNRVVARRMESALR